MTDEWSRTFEGVWSRPNKHLSLGPQKEDTEKLSYVQIPCWKYYLREWQWIRKWSWEWGGCGSEMPYLGHSPWASSCSIPWNNQKSILQHPGEKLPESRHCSAPLGGAYMQCWANLHTGYAGKLQRRQLSRAQCGWARYRCACGKLAKACAYLTSAVWAGRRDRQGWGIWAVCVISLSGHTFTEDPAWDQ